MKNITFSADEDLIERARKKALKQKTSLNIKFREWLKLYTEEHSHFNYLNFIKEFENINIGGKPLTREERNER